MQIKLSDHFSYGRLLRFTLPSIIMMVISSIYSVVDGLFVSNLVGDLALSSVNIVFPVAMIVGSFGFMLGTGGSVSSREYSRLIRKWAGPVMSRMVVMKMLPEQ